MHFQRTLIVFLSFVLASLSVQASSLDNKCTELYDAIVDPDKGIEVSASIYQSILPLLQDEILSEINKETAEFFVRKPGIDSSAFSDSDKRDYYMVHEASMSNFVRDTYYKIQSPLLDSNGKPVLEDVEVATRDGGTRLKPQAVKIYHLDSMSNGQRMKLFLKTMVRRHFQKYALSKAESSIQVSYKSFNRFYSQSLSYMNEVAESMELEIAHISDSLGFGS